MIRTPISRPLPKNKVARGPCSQGRDILESGEMKMRYRRIFSALAFALLLGFAAQPARAQHRNGAPPPPPRYGNGPRAQQYRARQQARANAAGNHNPYQAGRPVNGAHPPSTYQPAPHTNTAQNQGAAGAAGNSRPAQTPNENAADPPEPGKLQPALAHRTQRHERSRGDLEAHVSGAAAVCPAHPASEVAADVARPQAARHRSSAYPAGHDSRRPPKIPERPAVHARPESRRAVRPPRPRSSPQSFQSVISHPRFSCFLQSASPKQEGILFFRPAMLTLTKHFLDLSQP